MCVCVFMCVCLFIYLSFLLSLLTIYHSLFVCFCLSFFYFSIDLLIKLKRNPLFQSVNTLLHHILM